MAAVSLITGKPLPVFPNPLHAWAAGFMDGEGHFSVAIGRKSTVNARQSISCTITATQVSREPLDRFMLLYGGKVMFIDRKDPSGRQQNVHRWYVCDSVRIGSIIPLWLPYLTVKLDEAEVMLQIVNLTPARGHISHSSDTYEERVELASRLVFIRRSLG